MTEEEDLVLVFQRKELKTWVTNYLKEQFKKENHEGLINWLWVVGLAGGAFILGGFFSPSLIPTLFGFGVLVWGSHQLHTFFPQDEEGIKASKPFQRSIENCFYFIDQLDRESIAPVTMLMTMERAETPEGKEHDKLDDLLKQINTIWSVEMLRDWQFLKELNKRWTVQRDRHLARV